MYVCVETDDCQQTVACAYAWKNYEILAIFWNCCPKIDYNCKKRGISITTSSLLASLTSLESSASETQQQIRGEVPVGIGPTMAPCKEAALTTWLRDPVRSDWKQSLLAFKPHFL